MGRQAHFKTGIGIPSKTVLGTSKQLGSGTNPDSVPRLKSTPGGTQSLFTGGFLGWDCWARGGGYQGRDSGR
eukprot:1148189-Pelagomonas_calceolata.AAC.2